MSGYGDHILLNRRLLHDLNVLNLDVLRCPLEGGESQAKGHGEANLGEDELLPLEVGFGRFFDFHKLELLTKLMRDPQGVCEPAPEIDCQGSNYFAFGARPRNDFFLLATHFRTLRLARSVNVNTKTQRHRRPGNALKSLTN